MILRRITQHVREQNWTAIGIDFVIVVVGVFIGIQVSNWNEARLERSLERVYLERLHDEAFAGLNGFLETTDELWTRRRDDMLSAYDLVLAAGPPASQSLNESQCNAITSTHSIIAFPYQFPSLEELNSSGRFSIVQDERLREKLTGYALMQRNSQSLVNYYTADKYVMSLEFPEYYQTHLMHRDAAWADEIDVVCRLDLMREDQSFVNRLTDAISRFNGYYEFVLRPEIDTVKEIHTLLDEALEIDHEEAN